MSAENRAVFLSYAREDAEAARRIADALRAFGIEVWFDQNELRGGDAWDTKIRKQIRECALFVPVISATTDSRGEGYFRREWKQGVERTHDMAASRAFLLPVVIDATNESQAEVPDEFLRVQWTRLENGVPTPDFVAQVKRLLDSPRAEPVAARSERGRVPASVPAAPAAPSLPAAPAPATRRRGFPTWAIVTAVAVVAGGAIVLVGSRRPKGAATAGPDHVVASAPTPPPAVAALSEGEPPGKSIAVLPFENMSADKANTFFCDGVQEDILTNLANIRALRVVSRTSVEKYRNTTEMVRQIAQELGVTYILEGSVQRAGNRVRVTGQLIHAATDEHVWAQAYDRDLTDVFSIQSELAQSIASALQMRISPEEKSLLVRKQTNNPAAYDLYLQARQVGAQLPTVARSERVIALLDKAVALDPTFGAAWGELADAHAYCAFSGYTGSPEHLIKAKAAIDRATAAAPDDPAVVQDLGTYYYYGFRDYARARQQYDRLAQVRPNDAEIFNALALILRREGKWAESAAASRRAVELEPSNVAYLRNLVSTLEGGNGYDEAIAMQRRITALDPENLRARLFLGILTLEATASTKEGDDLIASWPKSVAESPLGVALRIDWANATGNFREAIRLDRQQPYYDGEGTPHYEQALLAASNLAAIGDREGAIRRLGDEPAQLRAQLEAEPDNVNYRIYLAGMEALLGQRDAAEHDGELARAKMPLTRDALDGAIAAYSTNLVYAWCGQRDRAIAELPGLLRMPFGLKVQWLGVQAGWAPVHDDPRVKALIADPKNNGPLF